MSKRSTLLSAPPQDAHAGSSDPVMLLTPSVSRTFDVSLSCLPFIWAEKWRAPAKNRQNFECGKALCTSARGFHKARDTTADPNKGRGAAKTSRNERLIEDQTLGKVSPKLLLAK